jgi:hypothetical protein
MSKHSEAAFESMINRQAKAGDWVEFSYPGSGDKSGTGTVQRVGKVTRYFDILDDETGKTIRVGQCQWIPSPETIKQELEKHRENWTGPRLEIYEGQPVYMDARQVDTGDWKFKRGKGF